jgi:hypothetical protein
VTLTAKQADIRTRRGAKLLDRERPGWAKIVKLSALDMECCSRCVLGQLYGHFVAGLASLQVDEFEGGFNDDRAVLDRESRKRSMAALDASWRRRIRERRAKK